MKVTRELNTWEELLRNSWAGAVNTLRDIEEQGREYGWKWGTICTCMMTK